MKYLFVASLFAYFIQALANPSVGPTKSFEAKKASPKASQCNVNNFNTFYAGANCKEIKEQLVEILEEIRALKGNQTNNSTAKGLNNYFALKVTLDFFFSSISVTRLA